MATITDAEGTFNLKGNIVDPSGEVSNEMPLGEVTIKKGFSHSTIIELKPFLVKKPGTFRFEFFVGKKKFEFAFELREQVPEMTL